MDRTLGTPSSASRRWKPGLGIAASAALILLVSALIRWQGGPAPATAQAPARPPIPANAAAPRATVPSAAQPAGARPAVAAPGFAPAPRPTNPAVAAPAAVRAAAAARPQAPSTKDLKVMAVVNGEQITREELGRECLRRYGEAVLESVVNKQLISDACAKQNIQITEKDVDDEIDRVAGKFGLPRDRWMQLLREERGFSDDQYRREVIWPMLALRRLAAGRTEVTQEELQQAFEAEYGPKVKVRMIGVSSRQKADQVRQLAMARPDSFGELAKQHCEDPGVASARGVVPPIRKHVGEPQIEAAAFALKPGEISPVVQVANQYYLILCEEQLQATYVSSQHIPEIQKRLTDRIREQKLRTSASELFERLQKEAQVVNVYNDPQQQKQHPGVAALINSRPISVASLAEECLSRHGKEVLDGEINRKVLQQELRRKQQAVNEQDIDAEVARAAESYGYVTKDNRPDVERWLNYVTQQEGATVELYVRDAVWPSVALKKIAGNQVEVTEDDLRKSYESNYGERVEVLAIVLGEQRQAQKVWDMARNNPTDDFFAQLAGQYSIEPVSKSNGGKVPPIRRHGGQGVVEDEAFKLKAGQLSSVIAVANQYIILRCLGRTKPVAPDIREVAGELRSDIHEKKLRLRMAQEFDRLKTTAQIDNFLTGASQSGARTASAAGTKAIPASATKGPPAGK